MKGSMIHTKLPIGLLLGLTALIGGCTSSPASTAQPSQAEASATTTPAAKPTPSARPTVSSLPRLADTFDIGGGRSLYLECTGAGSPTILLEAGDTDTGADHWRRVYPSLIRATRTCFYDRASLGRSSAATGCRELDDINDDLDALLAAAKIDGPFILVGASGGG